MGDADTANIQKLIKKVIEATRCSPSQAELALYDNDNNIFAAVEYILDKGVEIESWTEHKSKKDKKKEEEERSKATRGQASFRGRGGGADRSGRGRGASASTSRGGGPSRGGGTSRGGRGQSNASRPQQRSQQDSGVLKPVDLNEDSSEWKGGSMEFKRSEPAAAPPAVPSGSSTTPSAPPTTSTISFAAVAAAAARREQQKNQPPPTAPAPVEPPRAPTPEPTPVDSVSSDEGNFVHEPASSHTEETVPVHQDEPVNVSSVHNVQAASPQLQANVTWTTQLKSDLGIGVAPISADVSPVKPPQQQHQFPASSTLPGVEFATDSAPTGLADYHFGFVDAPPAPPAPVEPTPPPQPTAAESLFANARHSAAAVAPLKTEMHLGNGEYRANSPPVSSALTQPRLGFGETSTVSYSPVPTGGVDTRSQNMPKPLSHMAAAQQQQQPQQTHQQQQQHQPQQQPMFPSQMPFSAYGNPYMYSPVTTGIRPEDYTAALLQSYPFGMPGMDMANLMGGGAFPQSSSSQSLTNQHRSDNHAIDNTIKFTSQTNRQENQQAAAVQPPPGFGSPFGMQPPQMNMLQQHYNPQQYPTAHFMMPNIGTAGGRQIYSQDDERKSFDKMSGVKSQQSQQPTYHNGSHYGGMGNNKKYNWNS